MKTRKSVIWHLCKDRFDQPRYAVYHNLEELYSTQLLPFGLHYFMLLLVFIQSMASDLHEVPQLGLLWTVTFNVQSNNRQDSTECYSCYSNDHAEFIFSSDAAILCNKFWQQFMGMSDIPHALGETHLLWPEPQNSIDQISFGQKGLYFFWPSSASAQPTHTQQDWCQRYWQVYTTSSHSVP